jgi:hypothetical protein
MEYFLLILMAWYFKVSLSIVGKSGSRVYCGFFLFKNRQNLTGTPIRKLQKVFRKPIRKPARKPKNSPSGSKVFVWNSLQINPGNPLHSCQNGFKNFGS